MDLIFQYIFKIIILSFGIFLIWSSYLMFFKPIKTKSIIALAGSTLSINLFELLLRLIVGIAFVYFKSSHEIVFKTIGYFFIFSAIFIMLIPMRIHNSFSRKAAEKLKPIYLKFTSIISLIAGFLLIFVII